MKILVEISGEQAAMLFEEGTEGVPATVKERAEFHGTRRREFIRAAILKRLK